MPRSYDPSMRDEAKAFKEHINSRSIAALADAIAAVDPTVDIAGFRRRASRGLAELELKARVGHVAAALGAVLDDRPFPDAATLVADAVDAGGFGMWEGWPAVTWVETHGLDHPDAALAALQRLTPHASGEFAVRPFLETHTDLTLATLRRWTTDPDEHVRRLVSEGSRPRLPWGRRLPLFIVDPAPVIELLDRLVYDPTEYVRRSVANNLNDIAKDHPEVAVLTAERWAQAAPEEAVGETGRLVARGLRTLVKDGHVGALAALGFDHGAAIDVSHFGVTPTVADMGDDLRLLAELQNDSTSATALVIDYRLHRVIADGSTSSKVFKWRTVTLAPGAHLTIEKRHRLRPVTVRTMHPGAHAIDLQVNGTIRASAPFVLRTGG